MGDSLPEFPAEHAIYEIILRGCGPVDYNHRTHSGVPVRVAIELNIIEKTVELPKYEIFEDRATRLHEFEISDINMFTTIDDGPLDQALRGYLRGMLLPVGFGPDEQFAMREDLKRRLRDEVNYILSECGMESLTRRKKAIEAVFAIKVLVTTEFDMREIYGNGRR